jgi:Zn-finger protein
MNKHSKFFTNKNCEYFPCHHNIPKDQFNCLFCYCPLYGLKDQCGGNFTYLDNGIKDCANCGIPHSKKAYDFIMSKKDDMMELGSKP